MRAARHDSIDFSQPADTVFQAALGVQQNTKNVVVLAVHNEGRKLVVREKSMMSNRKFHQVWVEEKDAGSTLNVVVGTDPRTPKAMMDGKANDKSLKKYLQAVQGAVDGSAPAPVTPVANHYLQKKTEVPWTDPDADPEIELDGNIVAMYGL
ncbi:hypothetical protein [Aeromicrobium sp. CTD01-1L150]|uniref:hypothetical protein n=1 Tax=Aeromicrobium sp. CTD01-1L150 TaxID=3341830 RepID=UPI0035C0E396